MLRQLLNKIYREGVSLAPVIILAGCSVGGDLSGKQFACATTSDCVGGAYCDPSQGVCVYPEQGDGESLTDFALDAGAEVDLGDGDGVRDGQD